MHFPATNRRYTMGLGATGTDIANASVGTASAIVGANTTAIAATLGVSVPIVGIAIAGIVMAVSLWLNRMGPKQKRWTTQIADEATAQLQNVKSIYFANPYNPANQVAALGAVDQLLQAIQDGCGQSQMGEPGKRCISERLVRGGSAPWCPTGTGCDYLTEYRDPIANDPRAAQWQTQQQGVTAGADMLPSAIGGAIAQAAQSNWFPYAIAAAVGLVLLNSLGDN